MNHLRSKHHVKNESLLENINKESEVVETANHKIGMSRGRRIYSNVKNKSSIEKYEEDCVIDYKNGEDVGEINHSKKFAKQVVQSLGTIVENQIIKHMQTPLEATGQLPPFSLCTDKMTIKHRTNHLSAIITPDPNAPIDCDLLKAVYAGMPVVTKHSGKDIMEQILSIAEKYSENLVEQLQAFNNDGQYAEGGSNIKKHLYFLQYVNIFLCHSLANKMH